MGNCEKCGRLIEEGAVFCSNCSRSLKTEVGGEMGQKTRKTNINHEIFAFKRKYVSIFPDNIELEISKYILSVVFSIIGLIILFILYQRSKQDNFLFLALYILILTLSIAMIYPDEADIIVQI